jgi:hypothetical protein
MHSSRQKLKESLFFYFVAGKFQCPQVSLSPCQRTRIKIEIPSQQQQELWGFEGAEVEVLKVVKKISGQPS